MEPQTEKMTMKPRITASCDQQGHVTLFRIDVGHSRAMCTVDRDWLCWPQALRITPKTNEHHTLATDRPMPKKIAHA